MSASSAATFAAPTTDQPSVLPQGLGPMAFVLLRVRGGLGTAESPGVGCFAVRSRGGYSARKTISSRALVAPPRTSVWRVASLPSRERPRFELRPGRTRGHGRTRPVLVNSGGRLAGLRHRKTDWPARKGELA